MNTDSLTSLLKDWLSKTAKLNEVEKWSEPGDQPRPPAFMMGHSCHFLADGHHKMTADAFILDEALGSIGVVHCLGSDGTEVLKQRLAADAKTQEPRLLKGFIRQSIEEAVYLRHLMGMKVDASHLDVNPASTGRLLPSVELVFVLSEQAAPALDQVRDTLISMKQNTSLLHAIGINLVVVPETADPKLDPFDRGFAWLLRHTRTWWSSKKSGAGQAEKDSGNQRLKAIKTTQFRVSGTRIWTLQRPQTAGPFLHLIHGPNGSGKSSLAEAFEFAVTGSSTRVTVKSSREAASPWKSLIFDGHVRGGTARVDLTFDPQSELSRVTDGVNLKSVPGAPAAGALRVDQEVSDRLVKQDRYARMEHWLNAYFREARESLGKRKKARAKLKAAYLDLLPQSMRSRLESSAVESTEEASSGVAAVDPWIDGVIERLKPLVNVDGQGRSFDWLRLLKDPDLGLDSRWLDMVLEHDERVESKLSAGGDLAKEAVEQLLTQVADLMGRAATFLDGSLNRLFEGFETGAVVGTSSRVVSSEEFDKRYASWLTQVARADLILNAIHLRVSASNSAVAPDDVLSRLTQREVSDHELETEHLRAVTERDECRAWLGQNKRRKSQEEPSSQPVSVQAPRQDPKRWIQAVGRGVFGRLLPGGEEGAMKMLSDNIREAGWTQPFQKRLEQLEAMRAWMKERSWNPDDSASDWAKARFDALNRLLGALDELVSIGRQDAAELQRWPPQLAPALKELLELMTPASWAYKLIDVKVDLEGQVASRESQPGEASLEITSRGMELQDVLNTAELNTVALAMHLLCAPLARNPYRVTFLDDPLQNMDELTVTTVARAMAKLLRLMSQAGFQGWDIVMLLHGADDCERMVQEAPATFYRLPWSSPEQSRTESEPVKIKAESGLSEQEGKLFDFIGFLGLRGV